MTTAAAQAIPRPVVPWSHVDDILVDGRWRPAVDAGRLDVVDPATEQVWGSAPDCTARDVDAAVVAADSAFRRGSWPRLLPAERAAVLLRMADLLEARTDELAWTISRENGSPLSETRGAAANAASILRYTATLAPSLQEADARPFPGAPDASGVRRESLVRRDPIGVCALIAPWNFPINLVATKLAPALLAGCTVVSSRRRRPRSRFDSSCRRPGRRCARRVWSTWSPAVPRPAIALVRHPLVAKVAFTGSTPVGRRIAATCGELLRPVTLELGGKSAAICSWTTPIWTGWPRS